MLGLRKLYTDMIDKAKSLIPIYKNNTTDFKKLMKQYKQEHLDVENQLWKAIDEYKEIEKEYERAQIKCMLATAEEVD